MFCYPFFYGSLTILCILTLLLKNKIVCNEESFFNIWYFFLQLFPSQLFLSFDHLVYPSSSQWILKVFQKHDKKWIQYLLFYEHKLIKSKIRRKFDWLLRFVCLYIVIFLKVLIQQNQQRTQPIQHQIVCHHFQSLFVAI